VVTTSRVVACPEGITRGVVLEICRGENIPHAERDMSLAELYAAEEAFCTGTMGEIVPVVKVDGRAMGTVAGPGPLAQRISALFRRRTEVEGERVVG
jgi:branched-chain amino acid aminotransferase